MTYQAPPSLTIVCPQAIRHRHCKRKTTYNIGLYGQTLSWKHERYNHYINQALKQSRTKPHIKSCITINSPIIHNTICPKLDLTKLDKPYYSHVH